MSYLSNFVVQLQAATTLDLGETLPPPMGWDVNWTPEPPWKWRWTEKSRPFWNLKHGFFLFSNQTFHRLNRRLFGQQTLRYFPVINYDTCSLTADVGVSLWDLWWIKWHCKMYFFQGLWHFHSLTVHQCSTLVFPSSTTDGRYIIFAVDKVTK